MISLGCSAMAGGSATDLRADPNVQPGPVPGDPNDLRWDLAKGFGFVWHSVDLSAKTLNPATNKGDQGTNAVTLTISAKLSIFGTKDLLALDVENPVVLLAVDGNGGPLPWHADLPGDTRQYHRVGMESIPDGRSAANVKMMPSATTIELRLDPNRPAPSSIASIRGYLHALYVDKTIDVDIPYDPNGGWVESAVAPELMFCVDPTTPPPPGPIEYMRIPTPLVPLVAHLFAPGATPFRRKAVSLYYYITWVKSKTDRPVMALEDACYPRDIRALVEHVVIETQLFDSRRNRAVRHPTEQANRSDGGRGAFCQGWPGQDLGPFDAIRYIIGIHPVEVKIPFVLENIPVPNIRRVDE